MKIKNVLVIVLFIMVLVSGCSPTATRVIWNFEADGIFSFFPMSFYKIVNENIDRLSWYEVGFFLDECNTCKEDVSTMQNAIIRTDDEDRLVLFIQEKNNTCITDPRKVDPEAVKSFGNYPIEITEEDKIKIISGDIDEEKRKSFESIPLLTSGLVLNKDYIKNNLIMKETDTRYLYSVTYTIKNPETDPNNLYLKSKLGINCDFENITLQYDTRTGKACFSIYKKNQVSVKLDLLEP